MSVHLVTGAAGFIGFHAARRLLALGEKVIGVDNCNTYYDPALKKARLAQLHSFPEFEFFQQDIADYPALLALFQRYRPCKVLHLAAQAGVRHSLTAPFDYASSNLTGCLSVLECCRHVRPDHCIFASSSSVYGLNRSLPFSEHEHTDHPVSLYAASKKANEMMAHSYAHLYRIPLTGLRFFTVYGPWGRPDMAYYLFTDKILKGEPITVFDEGRLKRDFTYIDDVIDAIIRLLPLAPQPDPHFDAVHPDTARSSAPYRLFNIGNHRAETVNRLIDILEQHLGKSAIRDNQPMQPGDVEETFARIDDLHETTGFWPQTTLDEGLASFVQWYKGFYRITS
jgi:UDP-glucuronate 4-epimerase